MLTEIKCFYYLRGDLHPVRVGRISETHPENAHSKLGMSIPPSPKNFCETENAFSVVFLGYQFFIFQPKAQQTCLNDDLSELLSFIVQPYHLNRDES